MFTSAIPFWPQPLTLPWFPVLQQLAESEQQYAEIYEEYEKAREFYAGVEAAMHKAQQQYVRDKREWQASTGAQVP